MYLESLQFRHYRAFVDCGLILQPNGTMLIVGANNAGKTALLSGLDIVAGIKPGERVTRAGAEQAQLEAVFVLDTSQRENHISESYHRASWLASPALSKVRFRWASELGVGHALMNSIEVLDTHGEYFQLARITYAASAWQLEYIPPSRWTNETPADAQNMSLTSQASGGGAPPTLLGGLGEFEGLRLIYDDWRSRVYHFEALRTGTIGRTAPSHGVTRLAPTGVDLPQALLSLKSNDDPAWDQIVAIMQELVPDVGQLATPVEGAEVQIAFHDPFTGSRHNIKDLGTGVEQLLMTVYVGVRQPPGGIVVLEEPETNLHPAAQRTLLRYIREWSKERLFIIATHSPVFLDGSLSGDRVVLVERVEGVATATEAGDDLRRVLLALGVHLSDVLSARAVLLVEGRSDADVLRAWFPSLTAAGGTAVAEMEGGDKAWGAELLATLVGAADQLERRIMVLRDRDELPDDAVEKLESGGLVHVLRNRELENYLLEAEAIRDVLDRQRDQHSQDRSETCSVDELEAILRSAADSLLDQIVLKRVVARLKSIRLVDRSDVQALCSEGPSVEALIDLVTARFRGVDEIRDEIQDLWREEAAAVNAAWEGHWRELAPGEELLKAVWTTHGGAFQKNRDGPLIAAAMSKPPDEIAAIVKAL